MKLQILPLKSISNMKNKKLIRKTKSKLSVCCLVGGAKG